MSERWQAGDEVLVRYEGQNKRGVIVDVEDDRVKVEVGAHHQMVGKFRKWFPNEKVSRHS